MINIRQSAMILLLFLSMNADSFAAVVISQVYGGGGNIGATYTNDFVELFNEGGQTISLNGWTLQYASASGVTWQRVALLGELEPGRYYLIQLVQCFTQTDLY